MPDRTINVIVIHCAASPNGVALGHKAPPGLPGTQNTTAAQVIDSWHRARGFHRDAEWRARFNPELGYIGYHYVIDVDGSMETGRDLDEIGAHVEGHNVDSIGVCMVGTDHFARAQWQELQRVVRGLMAIYPAAHICGHRDLSPDIDHDGTIEPREYLKICPGFTVDDWLKGGQKPLPDHTLDDYEI